MVETLKDTHLKIKRTLDKKDMETAQKLLEECQYGAIALGTMIEASEGEGFVTVGFLEEYCELLYQIHEQKETDAKAVYEELGKTLSHVADSIESDIKVRKEVVFLPYKASMWDSLESVWKAAAADPDCDTYVIPIPYYDKNPDGSFREKHYEGDLYPPDVPVTRYDTFDFSLHHPDVIFIHNPYDQCNYVTSVEPFFYAENLKQYTDKLVYIPYFVLGEIDPQNEKAVEGMEHFVTVPGVIHADTVIVQSENMRQAYINVMTKYAGENTREIWEKKILGLGSPKFDKVLNTTKEDVSIPAEWLQIIRKPDGKWKKVILYNTSVSALLKYKEQMLEKIQYVFRIFKDNEEEVALLWRPHPLIQATIASMCPQLWNEYQKLVKQYKEDGWGIYDDTADLDRAIVICDAYYGDASSVVQLCKEAGKPIMLQNVKIV
jgi:hypothetical protein